MTLGNPSPSSCQPHRLGLLREPFITQKHIAFTTGKSTLDGPVSTSRHNGGTPFPLCEVDPVLDGRLEVASSQLAKTLLNENLKTVVP